MKIHCVNGLCDRLGMIFSFLKFARNNDKELFVYWPIEEHCNGHFLDIFNPVENINFIYEPPFEEAVDWRNWHPHPNFQPQKIFLYDDLHLLKDINDQVKSLRSELNNNYVSIQVRRTDKLTHHGIEKMTQYQEFFDFIDNNGYDKIFLASDNKESQNVFRSRYKDRLIVS